MTIDQFVNLTSGEYLACLEFVYEGLIKCDYGIVKFMDPEFCPKPGKDASRLSKRCYE